MSKILKAVKQTREDMTLKDNNDGTISIVAPCSFEKSKPLSDEEIHDIWKSLWEGGNIGHIAYNYARAIEERHGIK